MLDLVVAPHWTVNWPAEADAEDEDDIARGLAGVTTIAGRERTSDADIEHGLFAPCVGGVSGSDCCEYAVYTAGASRLGRGGVTKGGLFWPREVGVSGLGCGEYTVDTAGVSRLGREGVTKRLFWPCGVRVSGFGCGEYTVDTAGALRLGSRGVTKGGDWGGCSVVFGWF